MRWAGGHMTSQWRTSSRNVIRASALSGANPVKNNAYMAGFWVPMHIFQKLLFSVFPRGFRKEKILKPFNMACVGDAVCHYASCCFEFHSIHTSTAVNTSKLIKKEGRTPWPCKKCRSQNNFQVWLQSSDYQEIESADNMKIIKSQTMRRSQAG